MKCMATGGGLYTEGCRTAKRVWNGDGGRIEKSFSYTMPFEWHFKYRHIVDDHNNLRHGLPSLEDTWRTSRWALRVFCFLLAVTEVNTFLVIRYFVVGRGHMCKYHVFRRQLAWMFINNSKILSSVEEENADARRHCTLHSHVTAPRHASYLRGRRWVLNAATPYAQYVCKTAGCKKRVRTYCACDVGFWMCKGCYVEHLITSRSC